MLCLEDVLLLHESGPVPGAGDGLPPAVVVVIVVVISASRAGSGRAAVAVTTTAGVRVQHALVGHVHQPVVEPSSQHVQSVHFDVCFQARLGRPLVLLHQNTSTHVCLSS